MAMKTACCGRSLRSVALTFLYFNLILEVYGLLSLFANIGDTSYKQMMQEYSSPYFDTILMIVAALVFLFTIISISKEKPSIALLTASVVFMVVDVVYLVYGVIRLNAGGGFEQVFNYTVEKNARLQPENQRDEYRRFIRQSYSATVFLIYLVVMAGVAFKLYSALVFYSYKVDLQTRPVYSLPVRQSADDNLSAPAPAGYNLPNNTSPYPGQPAPYPQSVPVQYPGQILQHPSQPLPYPSQPPQYPSQPPQYPNLPPQYTIQSK